METIRMFIRHAVRKIRDFNYFASAPPTTDPYELRTQKISTYVFILTVAASIIILILYNSIIVVTKTITIEEPTLHQYLEFNEKRLDTFGCRCKLKTSEYQQILHVNYTLHQVCSSIFVTEYWIDTIEEAGLAPGVIPMDFRRIGPQLFRFLSSLCKQVDNTIMNRLSSFYTSQYLSIDLTPPNILQYRAESFFNKFKSSTINEYLSTLSIASDIFNINWLLATFLTNAYFFRWNRPSPLTRSFMYNNCDCSKSSICVGPSYIYGENTAVQLYNITGLYAGCYSVEALLQSNINCLYNKTCLAELIFHMNTFHPFNGTVLDASLPSGFSKTALVSKILDEMMVENWTLVVTYEKYFETCRPTECTYTVQGKNDVIYIVTALIGLIGGLIVTFELIIPRLVGLIRWKQRRTNTNTSKKE